jgi:hypothetical protein
MKWTFTHDQNFTGHKVISLLISSMLWANHEVALDSSVKIDPQVINCSGKERRVWSVQKRNKRSTLSCWDRIWNDSNSVVLLVPSYAACWVQGLADSKDKEPLSACASSYSHSTSKVMAIICILSGSQAWFIMMNEMNLKEKLLPGFETCLCLSQMWCGTGIMMTRLQRYSREFGIVHVSLFVKGGFWLH